MAAPIAINTTTAAPTSLGAPFTLSAQPGADLWRSPPKHIVSSAPMLLRKLDAASFHKASISVRFTPSAMYDQAGIVLLFDDPTTSAHWLKAGVEMKQTPFVSCVVTQGWSDWSLTPAEASRDGEVQATLLIERVRKAGSPSSAVWVYLVRADGTQQPLREVTSLFLGREADAVWVGGYVACPDPEQQRGAALSVEFGPLVLEE